MGFIPAGLRGRRPHERLLGGHRQQAMDACFLRPFCHLPEQILDVRQNIPRARQGNHRAETGKRADYVVSPFPARPRQPLHHHACLGKRTRHVAPPARPGHPPGNGCPRQFSGHLCNRFVHHPRLHPFPESRRRILHPCGIALLRRGNRNLPAHRLIGKIHRHRPRDGNDASKNRLRARRTLNPRHPCSRKTR